MMIRYLILGLAAAFVSPPAYASPIQVRSGDHQAFTRLAFDIAAGAQWEVRREGRVIYLSFTDHDSGFDIADVFDRIDRDHISNVTANASEVQIEMPCDCNASIFDAFPNMVAIDFSPSSVFLLRGELIKSAAESPNNTSQTHLELQNVDPAEPAELSRDFLRSVGVSSLGNRRPVPSTREEMKEENSEILFEIQRQLAKELGLATTQGMLDIAGGHVPDAPPPKPKGAAETLQNALPDALDGGLQASANIRFPSGIDLKNHKRDETDAQNRLGFACADASLVDVPAWSNGNPMSLQLASLRRSLMGEFDRVDSNSAIKLARLYIHYGFGLEAIRVVTLDNKIAEENGVLIELGEIMEFGFTRNPKLLNRFAACDSDFALWGILATREIAPENKINASAALRALSRLPWHLRKFVAPELSKRLVAHGDSSGAAAAMRIIERRGKVVQSDGQLAKAKIDLSKGDVATAQKRLKEVMTSNTEESAEALIAYVETRLSAEEPVSEQTALLAESYSNELREGPLAVPLRRAHVLALAQSGQFDAAFKALSDFADPGRSELIQPLRDEIFSLLARDASDIVFLDYTFRYISQSEENLGNPQTRLLVANRLSDLGFQQSAADILKPTQLILGKPAAKRLLAAISLNAGNPEAVEGYLEDLDEEQDKRILARARERMRDYEGANELFTDIADDASAGRTALLSSDWRSRLSAEAPTIGILAEIAEANPELPAGREGLLSAGRGLVEESKEARSAIRELVSK